MGKDREGTFHPKKGKPSGFKEEGLGLRPSITPEELEQDEQMTEKYTTGPDELAENIHLLHPNRNTHKGRDQHKEQPGNASDKEVRNTFDEETTSIEPEELPGILTKDILAQLAEFKGEVCVSLYIPVHESGMEVNEKQDLITYKNALQRIESELNKKNVSETAIKKLLEPAHDLLRNDAFWRRLPKGLAFFIADGHFKFIRLSFAPTEEVLINNSFYTMPLIDALVRFETFYLLVMTKKHVQFYRGDAFGLERLPYKELPEGIDDVVHFEEKDDQNLFRTGGRGGTGGANFHGIGAGTPDEKTNIAAYLKEVDNTLWQEILHRESSPLLLAGIEYMIPIYREVSRYSHIWPEAIVRGAMDRESDTALFDMAMEKMQPYFKQRQMKATNEYLNQSATPLTTAIESVIIPAAHYGRIQHLFVVKGSHIWGRFNEQDNQLFTNSEPGDNDECLVDKAVIKTLQTGGNVFVVPPEEMPEQSMMAAVLRY
jgi:hypothetical protein